MSTPPTLPPGARLLHVGPHKTGTTALQSALHQARSSMADQGVRYVARQQHDARAARWITQRMVAGTDPKRSERRWKRAVEILREPTMDRRVFSSEFLSDATDEQIATIVDQVGAEDLWIAITLRPLARILPSQYQQSLQRQGGRFYDGYLRSVLEPDPAAPLPPQFWLRHRHDQLAERWAHHVGTDHVVVVVLDPADHAFLPHAFEDLLGLRPDTLASVAAKENRSLTAAEAELLRLYNSSYLQVGLQPAHYSRLMAHLKDHIKARTPRSDEARLVTPDWAIDRANGIGAEMADNLRALGVTVLGDLDLLSSVAPSGVASTPPAPTQIDIATAAWFGAGLAQAADLLRADAADTAERATAKAVAAAARAADEPTAAPARRGLRGRLRG